MSISPEDYAAEHASFSEGVPEAFDTITKALHADPGYAWGWHCNIAMSMVDEGLDHYLANKGAARFMHQVFGVNTADTDYFKGLFKEVEKPLDVTL